MHLPVNIYTHTYLQELGTCPSLGCACMHTYIHTYVHTYIHTYIYIHTHTCRNWEHAHHWDVHTYIHTYIYIYICTYMHTHTCRNWRHAHHWHGMVQMHTPVIKHRIGLVRLKFYGMLICPVYMYVCVCMYVYMCVYVCI